MKKAFNRGFTLIELLVVIAIIGILSAVVLASLNTARNSAKDASAQASMSQMRAEAELEFTTSAPNSYAGVCPSGGALDTLVNGVEDQVTDTVTCQDSATAWVAEVTLLNATIFCSDSTGFAGIVATAPASGDFTCN